MAETNVDWAKIPYGLQRKNCLQDKAWLNAGLEETEVAKQMYRLDKQAINCFECPHNHGEQCDCKHAFKKARLPEWAGGQNQCIRFLLERENNKFCWLTPNGEVIVIPESVVDAIRNSDA